MTTRIPLGSLLRAGYKRPGAEIDHFIHLPEAGVTPAVDGANPRQTPSESAVKDTGTPTTAVATATPAAPGASDVVNLRKLLLGSLPEHYERQIERLEAKIAEGAADLQVAMSALEQRLEKRLTGVDADSRTPIGELRQQLLEEMRAVNEAIQDHHAEAMRQLEKGLQEVQNTKLDQATFSKFLEGLARYLGRDEAARTHAQEAQ